MAKYIVHHGIRIATSFQSEQFDRLTTLGPIFRAGGRLRQACKCSCGSVLVCARCHLTTGGSTSCGCKTRDRPVRPEITIHGKSKTRLYRKFMAMRERCRNKNNKDYGGRGISVCPRWLEPKGQGFINFVVDMGECPPGRTLDRIDVNGNYTPENCRWATRKEQENNKRNSRVLSHNGITQTLAQWAEATGLSIQCIHRRLGKYGYTLEEALTLPIRARQSKKHVAA